MSAVALCVCNVLMLRTGKTSTAVHRDRAIRVGLVFDVGGRGDKSFNDMAFIGVNHAVETLGVEAEYVEPGEGADRESGIRMFAARGFDLVVGVGFIFSDDLYAIAKEYPGVHFACIDYAKFDEHGFVVPPDNMVAVKFREEEGAFLVGALAALVSDTKTLGFVGGMDIPLIHKFEAATARGRRTCARRARCSRATRARARRVQEPPEGQGARARAVRVGRDDDLPRRGARRASACSRPRARPDASRSAWTATSGTRRPATCSRA